LARRPQLGKYAGRQPQVRTHVTLQRDKHLTVLGRSRDLAMAQQRR
jgi:hypothetical protein